MIEKVNINSTKLPQLSNCSSQSSVCFRGGDGRFERTPQNDTVQLSKKKDHTARNIAIGAVVAAGLAVAADFAFAKGKHIKKMFGKAEETIQKESKQITEGIDSAAKKEEGLLEKSVLERDLNDPLDPANKINPRSPHYEGSDINKINEGAYGQDVYDVTNPMNKYDVTSPYYDGGMGYGGYSNIGCGTGFDSGLGGYGSGFGY